MKKIWSKLLCGGLLLGFGFCGAPRAQAEVMLQVFNLTWQEIIDKLPEIAELGYTSLWLPPPQKASGDLSVGYDLWDPFDLGGDPQRTGGRTRYGTEEEMRRLIEMAHRFGLRTYFDNIMNHRAYDVPGYSAETPLDVYPGMLPEDFHLQVTPEGFYRPWPKSVNYGNTMEVQNRNLSGLLDISQETPNASFGPQEFDTHEKIRFVRHPNRPELYDYHPDHGHVGFGSPLITTNVIAEHPDYYAEDVGGYMMRSIRWLVDYTKLDGLRLDAVKHVPAYFFGDQTSPDKDGSAAGYIGQAQWQFHRTRGFSETNYRESVFDLDKPRTSLMVFGEHMGEPPDYWDYFNAGMRLVDAKTHQTLNDLNNQDRKKPGQLLEKLGVLETSDYVKDVQFGKNLGVYYAKSHDDAIAYNEPLHYAVNLTRAGLPDIYTDGNRHAQTLGASGGEFPRHANTRPFGQYQDLKIPNLVGIHNSFARGTQHGRLGAYDAQVLAYERRDKRENPAMDDADGTVLLFMMNRNEQYGEQREVATAFPEGALLWQYAYGGGQYYAQVTNGQIKATVPPLGYFAFSWRSPEESHLWQWGGGRPIEILSDGQQAETMAYVRRDGPDGDREFNPYNLPNRGYPAGTEPEPFTYRHEVPRAISASNLAFYAHVDGSAHNLMFKLDGGVPLNTNKHAGGDPRDNPPGWDTTDVYLGYEQAKLHSRIGPEKFGAADAVRNGVGSAGAETYEFVVGQAGTTNWASAATNDWDGTYGPMFVYHDPRAKTDDGMDQMWPAPQDAAGQDLWFQVKVGNAGQANRVFVYYTTDASWPEGAGGMGIGSTKVVELFWRTNVYDAAGGVATLAQDNAGNYEGETWTNGANKGSNFGAWSLNSSGTAGRWVGAPGWLLWTHADSLSEAIRPFAAPLATGQTFSARMQNGWIWEGATNGAGGSVGVALRNGSGATLWELMFNGGATNYTGTDGPTGIPWTDQSLDVAFRLTAANAYEVKVTPVGGATRTFAGTVAGQISQFRAWSYNNGTADTNNWRRDFHFNNLSVTAPGTGTVVTNDWWSEGKIAGLPPGTRVKYKVSGVRQDADPENGDVPFPNSWTDIARKTKRMGTWKVENFNPAMAVYRPHNDYGAERTGLADGFHLVAARAFLRRDGAAAGNGRRAAIFNTFYQPFYLDAAPPAGEIVYPAQDATLANNRYGAVVRTDPTVQRVWYNVVDDDYSNDDAATGSANGNGLNASGQVAWVEAQRVNPNILITNSYPLEWRFDYVNVPSSGSASLRVKLAEYSSATNPLLTDAVGRFTTLQRAVATRGPDYRMNVAWPQRDGDTVSAGYVVKVEFSRALWGDTPEETVRNRFLTYLNGVVQSRTNMYLIWHGEGNHELAFPLPDLFNGDPNYPHLISVAHTNAGGGGLSLYAERRVRVPTGSGAPTVQIVDPPEFDINGDPYVVVLPDVSAPTPADRQHNISVQTGPEAKSVWIDFAGTPGYAAPVPASTNDLTGTVAVTSNGTAVLGAGTTFEAEVSAGSVLQIGTNRVVVGVVPSNNYLTLTRPYPGPTASNLPARRITGNPTAVGNGLLWQFLWTNLQAGTYVLVANMDTNGNPATVEGTAQRTTRVMLRQVVAGDPDDRDDDDDGLYDAFETDLVELPESNSETWNNGDMHMWTLSGRTDPLSPDADGDGLPDGLELGWGGPLDDTDPAADTNGDGWRNFIGDRDPPVYNTKADNWAHPRYNINNARTDQIGGSQTDPNNADTDSDQLGDAVEDLNRNGRVEVGLVNAQNAVTNLLRSWFENRDLALPMEYNSSRVDRNALPANARYLETDPNAADTLGDGMSDGLSDSNANGRVDMLLLYPAGTTAVFNVAANPQYLLGMDAASQTALAAAGVSNLASRAINTNALFANFGRPRKVGGVWQNTNKWPRVLYLETDPLSRDTDADGLADGWETRYGLNPFDDGWYNLRTGQLNATNSQQGGDGDLTGSGVSNAQHQSAGTDPRIDVNVPKPPGSITIGAGPVIAQLNGANVYEEFQDWNWNDLRALDYFEGEGPNAERGDVYLGWDGFDESRDLVAFYTRDGGAVANGGDGKFYFRVDFNDLQAYAEERNLDVYVVIDSGNQDRGERVLPDDVDTLTDMRWELVVAAYDFARGRVYVDGNAAQNTSAFTDDLYAFGGVVGRENYYLGAHYNSALDAMEFAIDRQALADVGYIGDPAVLNFQVFAVKDGTADSPQGPGDIGGRSDVRDSILNDYLAEDDWNSQDGLKGNGSVLRQWIRGNNRPNRAHLAMIVHGNQAIQPGSVVQDLINNGAGAGYYRVLDAHQSLKLPLNLHVTPTLASALQWAQADPAAGKPWRDGPAFNARIAGLAATGTVALLASTFSDHMLPYFTAPYTADNVALATEFLESIYGVDITSNSVFWTPERVLDADVFGKIAGLGFRATVLDQMEHLFRWYGRTAALGTRGFQINRIDGVDTFAINNNANDHRYENQDGGLSAALRRQFNFMARGDWDQVVTLLGNWEDFSSKSLADAYDRNLVWIANHPWIQMVTLESILRGDIDLDGDGHGQAWYVENRASPGAVKTSHNYVNYMTRLNYDNWYLGSGLEEGLLNKVFENRPGVPMPNAYGMLYTGGVVSQAWSRVRAVSADGLARLARGVLHASTFETAFHSGNLGDMAKYSDGRYIVPDATNKTLAGFAAVAQAQSRKAAVYGRVQQWLTNAAALVTAQTSQEDVDLDGENEYLLYNRHAFAVFERLGGRMAAAWVRDDATGLAFQTVGNLLSWAGSETEWEGEGDTVNGTVGAYRTSALKDWYAATPKTSYANVLYAGTAVAGGWQIRSADNKIVKTVTLVNTSAWFNVQYAVDASLGALYVRSGLSPDLEGLLVHGQQYLGNEQHSGGVMTLANGQPDRTVSALVAYGGAYTAQFNTNAIDGAGFDTRRMRNQAQTHQVELSGSGTFTFALGFEAAGEKFNNGVPYSWLSDNGFDPATVNVNTTMAANGVNNLKEAYVANLDPKDPNSTFDVTSIGRTNATFVVRFATRTEREYLVWYATNGLVAPTWFQGPADRIQGTGGIESWTDPIAPTNKRFYKVTVYPPE